MSKTEVKYPTCHPDDPASHMTVRERMAMAAMQGMMAREGQFNPYNAMDRADDLIAALNVVQDD